MFNSGQFSSNKEAIKSILSSHGYKFTDHEHYISCSANYRNVIDTSSVVLYWKDDKVIDFAGGFTGSVKDFLQLVTEQKTVEELNSYLLSNNLILKDIEPELKIKQKKIFSKELLLYLQPNHDYPLSRGISLNTCQLFRGGFVGPDVKGKQKNRYVFPIFNSKEEVVGFTGRSISNDIPKWKHTGNKTEWVWPCFLNNKIISKCKSVILVESPMDCLYMWDAGIKNSICLFGVKLSIPILNYLLRQNTEKIIIATNNEMDLNGGVGNKASLEIKVKLSRYFDSKNIIIKLPSKKDFCDMGMDDVRKYKQELIVLIGDKYFNYE